MGGGQGVCFETCIVEVPDYEEGGGGVGNALATVVPCLGFNGSYISLPGIFQL
jgi:hypothetical protein